MDIGKRLRELRHAKGMSQGDVEDRLGLSRCYISQVENGRTIPTLGVLERWARAMGFGLHQIFMAGEGQREATGVHASIPIGSQELTLLGLFRELSAEDKSLLISLAREMLKRKGERE